MKRNLIFLIVITLIGLFFYSFRLKETMVFTDDTARDTLRALQIWQNKELTLIGPPASFSLNSIREVYFGSFYLYIGILGLSLTNWNPIGAVLPNTILFTLSILFFYKFLVSQIEDKSMRFFALILYTFSPITVIHSRFFWNPNLIIPISVIFWYLITKKAENKKKILLYSFFAGIVGGIMFNLHYIVILPVVSYLLILFFSKQIYKSLYAFLGLVISSLPILIFELRNDFYLIKSLLFNILQHQGTQTAQFSIFNKLDHLTGIFASIIGLKSAEIEYPVILNLSSVIILIFLGFLIFLNLNEIKKIKSYWIPIILSIAAAVYFSFNETLLIRYLFPVYPLIILLIAKAVYFPKNKYISLIIFIPIIYSSIGVLFDDPKLGKSYISLEQIERICQSIVGDNPKGRYNITENIRGDARAMAFRYCLNKDTKIPPQNELTYTDLSTLYVVSPSLEKTYKDMRWEFAASGPWKLEKEENIDSVNLYKFIK